MENLAEKCSRIYNILCERSEHIVNLRTKEFNNLEKFGVTFDVPVKGKEGETTKETLRSVHFDCSITQFLPNGRLYWDELEEGTYEKIVEELYYKIVQELYDQNTK